MTGKIDIFDEYEDETPEIPENTILVMKVQ